MWNGSIKSLLIIILHLWIQVKPSASLFLHVNYTDSKCFILDIPDDTMVRGKFKVELVTWNGTWGNYSLLPEERQAISETFRGLIIQVRNPSAAIVLSKLYGLEGRFTFTSYTAGEHFLCLEPNGTAPASSLESVRLHLDVKVGGLAVDYEIVNKKEKLTEVQLRIRKLLDLIDQIAKEQNYQRVREARFRYTSDTTKSRIFWFALLQTVFLLGTGYFQIRNLKEFFIQKKLV